jgi:hypothetical protein
MKITTKIKDGYIPYKVYEDVDSRFLNFVKHVRVLPAEYFDQPNEFLTLKAMYQPGEKKSFPDGGFEVYHDNGCMYNYGLDQVIVHPYVLGIKKFGNDKDTTKIKIIKETNTTPGKRGRKPLSPEEKMKREEQKAQSSGKKGRPSKYTPEQKAEKLAYALARKGGKRGRKKKQE